MRKCHIGGLIAGAVVLISGVALAGYKSTYPVSVTRNSDGSGWASGAIGSARNSADTTQAIYCYVTNGAVGVCGATDSTGKNISCSTTSAAMMASINSLLAAADAYISINVTAGGSCSYLYIYAGSALEPKK